MTKQPTRIVGWVQTRNGMPDITGIRVWGDATSDKPHFTPYIDERNCLMDTLPSVCIDGIGRRGVHMALRVRTDVFEAEAVHWLTEHGYTVTRPTVLDREQVIACPSCGSESIYVVQVECMEHTKAHRFPMGEVVLDNTGFEWLTHAGDHQDWSTTNEIAECQDCKFNGSLDKFGFGGD
jgi:hypothetical protein